MSEVENSTGVTSMANSTGGSDVSGPNTVLRLAGSDTADSITGGKRVDLGCDTLAEFEVGTDKIAISSTLLGADTLVASDFSNTGEPSARIFYDPASGSLSIKTSAAEGGEVKKFAVLPAQLDLSVNDFEVF